MKLLGKGAFTKAYLKDEKTVILHSSCPIKECLSLGWFPESDLFPKIERIEYDEVSTYKMKYYPKVRSLKKNLNPDQYEIYKELRKISKEAFPLPRNHHKMFNHWHKQFNKIKNEELRETMEGALNACGNYGSDISFEISPRNVAVDNGKLVLIDCFYSISKLNEVQKRG